MLVNLFYNAIARIVSKIPVFFIRAGGFNISVLCVGVVD